jgi:hypothetical protein
MAYFWSGKMVIIGSVHPGTLPDAKWPNKCFFLREQFRKLPGIMVAMESGHPETPLRSNGQTFIFYQGTPWYQSGHGKVPSLRIKGQKLFLILELPGK